MTALQVGHKRRSPVGTVAGWLRKWAGGDCGLECCLEQDVEHMAQDIGVSQSDLRSLAPQGPGAADLLLRRMAALDLDPEEVAATNLATFRDLQRVCSMCESKKRCARDMAGDCALVRWQDYCPNAATLTALNALPWKARNEW